jgi:hypothetical protein
MRHIPRSLLKPFKASVIQIVRHFSDPVAQRHIIYMLPLLVSMSRARIDSNDDWHHVRDHIILLANEDYLHEQLNALDQLLQSAPTPYVPREQDESRRTIALVSNGLFGKALREDDATPAPYSDVNLDTIQKMFPDDELPTPLPHPDALYHVSIGEMLAAVKRLRRGKAPAVSERNGIAIEAGWGVCESRLPRERKKPVEKNPPPF